MITVSKNFESRLLLISVLLAASVVALLHRLVHAPASVRARPRDVEDAARRLLQAEVRADLVVDLLRALGVVHHHCDGHVRLLCSMDLRRARYGARHRPASRGSTNSDEKQRGYF